MRNFVNSTAVYFSSSSPKLYFEYATFAAIDKPIPVAITPPTSDNINPVNNPIPVPPSPPKPDASAPPVTTRIFSLIVIRDHFATVLSLIYNLLPKSAPLANPILPHIFSRRLNLTDDDISFVKANASQVFILSFKLLLLLIFCRIHLQDAVLEAKVLAVTATQVAVVWLEGLSKGWLVFAETRVETQSVECAAVVVFVVRLVVVAEYLQNE